MERLAGEPVRYVIVGGGSIDVPPGIDAVNLGWRDSLYGTYEDISLLIRYTPHDGLSLMVLEALSFGRHVIWTQEFPFVHSVSSYTELERAVRELLGLHRAGELHPQRSAAQLVEEQYSPDACVRTIAQAWEDALAARTPARLAVETP
jgi:glycosyltransferase involved in cell wall biosynthesis